MKPLPIMEKNIAIKDAAPSTIAASMTWPLPERDASNMPQTKP